MIIDALMEKNRQIRQEIKNELESMWPIGSKVMVYLNAKQINPTQMEVSGYTGDGYIRVKTESRIRKIPFSKGFYSNHRKPWFRRDVYYSEIAR